MSPDRRFGTSSTPGGAGGRAAAISLLYLALQFENMLFKRVGWLTRT